MLERLDGGSIIVNNQRPLPPLLNLLLEAVKNGQPLEPVMEAIIRSFGFDSFMYGASLSIRPDAESQNWVFTTQSRPWIARYDQRSYIEVDPRILRTAEQASPFFWDQSIKRNASKATLRFLEDARNHGIASGVAMSIPSPFGLVVVAFNSSRDTIDTLRGLRMDADMGQLELLGRYFHDTFMASVIMKGKRPIAFGLELSPQQRRCLAYVAHGYPARDIAICMKLSVRTVDTHLCLARTKLDARNSTEGASIAVSMNMVRMGEVPSHEAFLAEQKRMPRGKPRYTRDARRAA